MDREERPSLVDGAEQALRAWLAPGRYRHGDRLPPEYELAAMLGISRGTLRSALRRLEQSGEIVRRQGSGTYVGRIALPMGFGVQLQRLEGYSAYARRRGVKVSASHLKVELRGADQDAAQHLMVALRERATVVSRTLLAGGTPVAEMHDVFHPSVAVPDAAEIRRRMRGGETIIDVLNVCGVEIAFSRTVIAPVMLDPHGRLGRRLKLREATACLELSEVIYAGGGDALLYSRDVFTPGGIDIEFVRSVDTPHPPPVGATVEASGRGARN